MKLQQSFVNGTQMPLGQVTVINKLPAYTSQFIDGKLEMLIAHCIVLQEGMAFWVEEATIEGRHVERWAAFVDNAKECLQLRPEGSRIWQQRLVCFEILLDTFLYAF